MKLNSKKGSESLANGYVITGIIAGLIIVLVLTGFWKKIDFIVYAIELIGFQTALPQGNGIVGLNMVNGNLEYYTGEAFKKFSDDDVVSLAGYEFNVKDISKEVSSFYLDTTRRPEILIAEINHWRYWTVSLGKSFDTLGVIAFTKKGYTGPAGESYLIDEKNGYALSGFAKIDSLEPSKPIEKIIEWRDSILQGNKCEKFLTLKVKENEVEKDISYTVRRVDRHLVIDLTKPVSSPEKWVDVNCFGFVNYKDDNLGLSSKIKDVTFSYTTKSSYFAKRYASKLYWYPRFPWWSGNFRDLTQRSDGNNIYPGLIELLKKDGLFDKNNVIIGTEGFDDQGVFINDMEVSGLGFVKGKQFSDLNEEERDRFRYIFLSEYNKNFVPEVVN